MCISMYFSGWKRNIVRSSRVIPEFLKYTIQPWTDLSGGVSVSEDISITCRTEAVNNAIGSLQIPRNSAPKKRKRTGQSNQTAETPVWKLNVSKISLPGFTAVTLSLEKPANQRMIQRSCGTLAD